MNTSTHPQTEITADPSLPTLTIVREFDATPDKVFRAHIDPELVVQWLGPHGTTMKVDTWDARTGGSYRYVAEHEGQEYGFYGAFHEVRPNDRIVQTFTFEGVPDGVSLDTVTFEELPGGRTRLTGLSVVDSMEARDAMVASGMETGVVQGYESLDDLLAADS
ncbi:MAG: SRPBCC family protein [Propionibacteriales bacterium]|nr:SRPBCC family protein [Propionibacteriales bacterium]